MKQVFRKAWKIYRWLFLAFVIIFAIAMVIDDWGFVEKYWSEKALEMIMSGSIWCLIFGIVSVSILLSHKFVKKIV